MSQQQQQQELFYGYPNAVNRSPSLPRQGYATTAGLSSSGPGNRANQRPLDVSGPPPVSMYPEERYGPFDANSRYDRMNTSSALHNNLLFGSNPAWSYNSQTAATVNGGLGGDGGRIRQRNQRGALPNDWMQADQGANAQNLQGMIPHSFSTPMVSSQTLFMGNGFTNEQFDYSAGRGLLPRPYQETLKDANDLIPTAIVIKNIPFNIRKEALSALMTDMNLPVPYAFNYHFDNGVFRGLAFANFQNPDETRIVIEKMNGLEVGGRKLRVEYKKMLPEHERERIEREKREKRGQLEEQHRTLPLHTQSSIHSLTTNSNANANASQRHSPLRDVDLNDPETLNFYTELTLFRSDTTREILVFPNSISPEHRRQIHVLAHNMGLEHRSVNEGDNRQLHVMKRHTSPNTHQPSHLHASGPVDSSRKSLNRAATFDFDGRPANGGSEPPSTHQRVVGRQNHMLAPASPDAAANGLRGVKSFADLRSFTPSPSLSQSSYANVNSQANGSGGAAVARFGEYSSGLSQASTLVTPTTPSGVPINNSSMGNDPTMLVNPLGSLSLGGGGFDLAAQPRPRDNPGAIGSQRPGVNGSNRANAPDRQPRGPGDWESPAGFGGRGRANGHMQRGSESSDSAARAVAASSTTQLFH